jgi:hypothetical protein
VAEECEENDSEVWERTEKYVEGLVLECLENLQYGTGNMDLTLHSRRKGKWNE